MRLLAILATTGAVVGINAVISGNGVQVRAPAGWHHVAAAGDWPVTDPRTLLVVGTAGVRPHRTQCQVAAYRVPPGGAVVVVIGWRSAHGAAGPGRNALTNLTSIRRPLFECFNGRGASATLVLRGREYQVNVMVGDRASQRRIAEALAVARSFELKP